MAANFGKQTNIVANPDRHLIFFEGEDLCYNYMTDQWSLISAYDTFGFYGINSPTQEVGLVIYSGNAVDLQVQDSGGTAQTATFTSGARDLNQGGRSYVDAVRPLANGGTYAVSIGVQDNINDSVTWSTGTSPNSRSLNSNFRSAANTPEGRFVRTEVVISGGFTTALGADIEFYESGDV
jgi:hypothetical protein